MSQKVKNQAKIYRISPFIRAVSFGILILFLIILLVGGLLTQDKALVATALVTVGILSPISVITLWWYPRLMLTSTGIEVRQIGYKLFATWQNIESIDVTPGSEGLILKISLTGHGAHRLARYAGLRIGGVYLFGSHLYELINEKRFIPLIGFGYWLSQGNLKDDFHRHVPGLTFITLIAVVFICSNASGNTLSPEQVAKLVLQAYQTKNLNALSKHSNKKIITEISAQGESHPRYRSI